MTEGYQRLVSAGEDAGATVTQAPARKHPDTVKQYIFISSLSVYADHSVVGIDETAPVGPLTEQQLREVEQIVPLSDGVIAQAYGPLKARCEQVLEEVMPGRVLSIRPGLIVGPYDYSDRFTYWPARVARGGELLAPGRPDRFIQLIDVRDVADWLIKMGERGQTGIYNSNGPASALSIKN